MERVTSCINYFFASIMVHNKQLQNAVTKKFIVFSQICESAGLVLLHVVGLQIWAVSTCLPVSLVPLSYSGHIFLMVMLSRDKPNHRSIFQAEFCVTAANILLASAKHMTQPKVRKQAMHSAFSRTDKVRTISKSTFKEKTNPCKNQTALGKWNMHLTIRQMVWI